MRVTSHEGVGFPRLEPERVVNQISCPGFVVDGGGVVVIESAGASRIDQKGRTKELFNMREGAVAVGVVL